MLINELVQWAILIFMGVFVLGLTRQLGHYLLSHAERLSETGPRLGSKLPKRISTTPAGDAARAWASRHPLSAVGIVVIDEDCEGCVQVVQDFERGVDTAGLNVLALVKRSGHEFEARAQNGFDLAMSDPDGQITRELDVNVTPFLLVVDEELRIIHKVAGSAITREIRNWVADARAASMEEDFGRDQPIPRQEHVGAHPTVGTAVDKGGEAA